jgi:carbonic anhydrase
MSNSLLGDILEKNRQFLNGSAKSLDSSGEPFIVISCIDPRLTGLLEPALGLPRHRAIQIRSAGNVISPGNPDILRSVAAGLFLKNAKEVFLVGHTDCAMARFSAQEAIESFRIAGIPRSAFGNDDLRSWFGAFPDIRANILQGIAYLRKSGIVPAAIKIHGLLLDSGSGALELVFDGSTQGELPKAAPAAPDTAALVTPADQAPARDGKTAAHRPAPPAISLDDIVKAFRKLVLAERQNRQFQIAMAEFVLVLKRERDAGRILTALEKAVAPFSEKHPECRHACEELSRLVGARGPGGLNIREIMQQVFEGR